MRSARSSRDSAALVAGLIIAMAAFVRSSKRSSVERRGGVIIGILGPAPAAAMVLRLPIAAALAES